MTRWSVALLALALITVASTLAVGGCKASQASATTTQAATTTPVATTPTATSSSTTQGQSITINLTAKNIAFDTRQITVPAGAAVTVIFKNEDAGISHNFSVYQNLPGGQTKAVFVGNTITGPNTITYHFTAPPAGNSYFFECNVHPTMMNGTFTVTP
jgi:plastocyanin